MTCETCEYNVKIKEPFTNKDKMSCCFHMSTYGNDICEFYREEEHDGNSEPPESLQQEGRA